MENISKKIQKEFNQVMMYLNSVEIEPRSIDIAKTTESAYIKLPFVNKNGVPMLIRISKHSTHKGIGGISRNHTNNQFEVSKWDGQKHFIFDRWLNKYKSDN